MYKKVRDISFGRRITRQHAVVEPPTQAQIIKFLDKVQQHNKAIAVMQSFCGSGDFRCNTCKDNEAFQCEFKDYDLRNLYQPGLRHETEADREIAILNAFDNMVADPVKLVHIEEATRQQSESKFWKIFRFGRITASNLREVCGTDLTKPSLSLLKKICYENNIKSAACQYGKENEAEAFEALFEQIITHHDNPTKAGSGLIISHNFPCLGATPDGIINCDCHGKITVEIKCPYVGKDCSDFTDLLLKLKDPYVKRTPDGEIILNTKHKYYYQSLMQLHLTNASFGYFYIWSKHKQYIFEIHRNDDFWNKCQERAVNFFKIIVLREMMFKAYTNPI